MASSQDQAQKTPSYTYFNFDQQNPDAIVILNRGSTFEQDLTGSVISFNTSNSIDSVTGSFSVVLDNTNDVLVNRFGFTNIKKMSSIEIFAKNPGMDPDPRAKNFVVSKSIRVSGGEEDGNISKLVNRYYGQVGNLSTGQDYVDYVLTGVNELNRKRTQKLIVAYEVHPLDIISNSDNNIKEIQVMLNHGGGGGEIKFVSNDPAQEPYKNILVESFLDEVPIDSGDGGFFRWDQNLTFTIKGEESINSFDARLKANDVINATSRMVNNDTSDPIYDPSSGELNQQYQGTYIKLPAPKNAYPRIFYGIVIGVAQNVQPGSNLTITINGKGIGYWLEASMVNTFPGGYEQTLLNQDLSVFANRYAAFPALEIFRDLIRFSTDDLIATSNFSTDTFQTQSDYLILLANNQSSLTDVFGAPQQERQLSRDEQGNVISKETNELVKFKTNNTTPITKKTEIQENILGVYRGRYPKGIVLSNDWASLSSRYVKNEEKLVQIDRSLVSLNSQLQSLNNTQGTLDPKVFKQLSKDINKQISDKNTQKSTTLKDQTFITTQLSEKVSDSKVQLQALQFQASDLDRQLRHDLQKGRQALFEQFGIIRHWKDIFSSIMLEVLDEDSFLNLVYPFKWDIREPGANMDGEYTSKAALGQTIAERIFYEFYFDTNGHFVLKPPLYNIKPEGSTGGQTASGDYRSTYILEDNDIINMSMNDTAEGIVTRVGVVGDYKESPGIEKTMIYNIFQDLRLVRDYGFFAQEKAELLFIHNNAEARDFGRAWMSKNNMELVNASVTIIGRPEIRLGTTVWLKPRDTYYYVREISHSMSAGGEYQTTLTLTGGRRIIVGFQQTTKIFQVKRNTKFTPTKEQTIDPQPTLVADGVSDIIHYVPIFQAEEPTAFDSFTMYSTDENLNLINEIRALQTQIDQLKGNLASATPVNSQFQLPPSPTPEQIATFNQAQAQAGASAAGNAQVAILVQERNIKIDQLRVPLYNSGQPLPPDNDDAGQYILKTPTVDKSKLPQVLRNMYVITSHVNPAYIGLIVSSTDNGGVYKQINENSYNFFATELTVKSLPTNVNDLQLSPDQAIYGVNVIKGYFEVYMNSMPPFSELVGTGPKSQAFTVAEREKFVLKFLSDIKNSIVSGGPDGMFSAPSMSTYVGDLSSVNGKNKLSAVAKLMNYLISDIDTHQGFYAPYTDADGREFPAYLDYGKSLVIEAGQAKIDASQQAQTASEKKTTTAAKKASQGTGFPGGATAQALLVALAKQNAADDAKANREDLVVRENTFNYNGNKTPVSTDNKNIF